MIPAIRYMQEGKANIIKIPLKRILIICGVGMIEKYATHSVKKIIDKSNLDITAICHEERIGKYESAKYHASKGEFIASSCNFGNLGVINRVFTHIVNSKTELKQLNMNFLELVKKLNWYDPYKYLENTRSLHLNFQNLDRMFQLRHNIVHDLQNIRIDDSKIFSFCDNVMNFIDAASWISYFFLEKEAKIEELTEILKSEKPLWQI